MSQAGHFPEAVGVWSDPQGRSVALSRESWGHISTGHPELKAMLDKVGSAVQAPTRDLPGRASGERWLYLHLEAAPAPWLKVVVRYEQQGDGWVVTAFLRRKMP